MTDSSIKTFVLYQNKLKIHAVKYRNTKMTCFIT